MTSGPRARWFVAVLLSMAAPTVQAQGGACGAGSVEVGRLEFEGNHSFPTAMLAAGIVTAPSTWASEGSAREVAPVATEIGRAHV